MATQVNVTLTALNGGLTPAERNFTLDPDRSTIQIGRASKSLSKGLQGTANNAWFDSPVMSRDHAELSIDSENKTLRIKDIGSMHGTILNNMELPRKEYKDIMDGDVVIFGAEVKRGAETFPACAFRVNYIVVPHKTMNTFTFPDSSDMDEEEWCGSNKSDSIAASSEDDVFVESPRHEAPQASDPIDLTRDESPVNPGYHGIDHTGDDSVRANMSESVAAETQAGAIIEATQRQSYIEIESVASEDEGDYVAEYAKEVHGTACDFGSLDSDLEDVLDSTDDEPAEEHDEGEDDGDQEMKSDDEEGLSDRDEQRDLDSIRPTQIGSEALHECVESRVLEDIPGCSYIIPQEWSHAPSCDHFLERPYNLPTGFSVTPVSPESFVTGERTLHKSIPQNLRDPSPSDAAMAKPVDGSHKAYAAHSDSIAQSLGEKSGKEDFFSAREHNKARLQAAESNALQTSSNNIPAQIQSDFAPSLKSTSQHSRVYRSYGSKRSRYTNFAKAKLGEPADVVGRVHPSPDIFDNVPPTFPSLLDTPNLPPIVYRTPSPALDMTSAVKFNESKAAALTATINKTTGTSHTIRSGLRIDDIIDTDSVVPRHNKLKRKSDAISEAVEEEVRIWGSTANMTEVASAPQAQSLEISPVTGPPPAKKLRKLMEVVAYAALGGVALFGGLVATAPDFI